jgi:hypothetical protein
MFKDFPLVLGGGGTYKIDPEEGMEVQEGRYPIRQQQICVFSVHATYFTVHAVYLPSSNIFGLACDRSTLACSRSGISFTRM